MSKVLTLGAVIEIIATTRVPEGEVSADDKVLERIKQFTDLGYELTSQAEREVTLRLNNKTYPKG